MAARLDMLKARCALARVQIFGPGDGSKNQPSLSRAVRAEE